MFKLSSAFFLSLAVVEAHHGGTRGAGGPRGGPLGRKGGPLFDGEEPEEGDPTYLGASCGDPLAHQKQFKGDRRVVDTKREQREQCEPVNEGVGVICTCRAQQFDPYCEISTKMTPNTGRATLRTACTGGAFR